jgi:hypothetical protein
MSRREGKVFDGWTIVLGLFGLGNVANGLWMLVDPVHWYHTLPAGVPDFGPLNEHFVRDIGCIYLLIGMALLVAAFRPSLRALSCGAAAAFLLLHGVVHVVDTARGFVGPEHWWIDLPGVYAPALIVTALYVVLRRPAR